VSQGSVLDEEVERRLRRGDTDLIYLLDAQ